VLSGPGSSSLLKGAEVPTAISGCTKLYKPDSADRWMCLRDPKTLASEVKSKKERFARFARQSGEFSIRKLDDHPEGGEGGLESGLVHAGDQPIEVYFAPRKSSNRAKSKQARADRLVLFS
jgi:hypothetical protein